MAIKLCYLYICLYANKLFGILHHLLLRALADYSFLCFVLGQFYVMMSPPDVLQTGTQRTIAPRTQTYAT